MNSPDNRKLIAVLYILTVVFLGIIYWQGNTQLSPDALNTLKAAGQVGGGSTSASFAGGFQIQGDSAFLAMVSLTFFFGIAWLLSRSKTS